MGQACWTIWFFNAVTHSMCLVYSVEWHFSYSRVRCSLLAVAIRGSPYRCLLKACSLHQEFLTVSPYTKSACQSALQHQMCPSKCPPYTRCTHQSSSLHQESPLECPHKLGVPIKVSLYTVYYCYITMKVPNCPARVPPYARSLC